MIEDLEATSLAALEWLYENGAADNYQSVNAFLGSGESAYHDSFILVDHLETRGLVRAAKTNAMLTGRGVQVVQEARRRRTDPARRVPAVREGMLRWLYGMESQDVPAPAWDEFVGSAEAMYLGDRFNLSEVKREGGVLYKRGLIHARHIDGEPDGWIDPSLTSLGRECVIDHGGSVSAQEKARNASASYHFAGNSGAISVNSNNVTQTVSHGVDTAALLKFAQAAVQMLPVLDGIPEDEHGKLREDAAEVEAEAAKPQPDVNKLQQLFNAMYLTVLKAAPSVAAEMLTGLGHHASQALGLGG